MAEPITYALHREACPALARHLGGEVELRELSYGALKRALRASPSAAEVGDSVLGASLYLNGEPVGLEGLEAMPGHLTQAIAAALARCLELHGMSRAEDDDAPAAAEGPPSGEA